MLDYDVELPDGRNVSVAEYGDPSGQPLLHLHGAGESRSAAAPLGPAAEELGVRVIALDRPGVERSTPSPGFTPLGYGREVGEIVDALRIDHFAISGYSNGGMFACAAAQVLGERVTKVIPINPTTPVGDPAVKAVLQWKTRASYAFLQRFPDFVARNVAKRAAESFTHEYLVNEMAIAVGSWGFDHLAVTQRVEFISGETDAGRQYAEVWAAKLPNATFHLFPGGHSNFFVPETARGVMDCIVKE